MFFSGNVVGRLPYEAGASCNACTSDLPECQENLCSPGKTPPTKTEAPPPATTEAPTSPLPSGQLSAFDREEILRAHNHVRSLVSPSATNMRRLVSMYLVCRVLHNDMNDYCVYVIGFEKSDHIT